MGVFNMMRLTTKKDCRPTTRVLALVNVAGCSYFALIAGVAFYMGPFVIVLELFKASYTVFALHTVVAWFLLVNLIGNYIITYSTDCSIATLKDKWKKHNREKLGIECGHVNLFTCRVCQYSDVPERAHHCRLCSVCVLKRDHHCFFMGSCIGYHNQRYFTVFCLYTCISGLYSTVLLALYLKANFGVKVDGIFCILLFGGYTLNDWWSGDRVVTGYEMFIVGLLYAALSAAVAGACYFCWQVKIIIRGQTTYEARKNIVAFRKSTWENYLDVFGKHWFICWVLPVPCSMSGDGIYARNTAETDKLKDT